MSVCLETARLILRDYVPEDLDAYFRLKTDEETMYYLQDIRLSSREEAEREFAEVLADAVSPDRRFYFLHMEEKDTGEQAGSIGYTVRETAPRGNWWTRGTSHIRSSGWPPGYPASSPSP